MLKSKSHTTNYNTRIANDGFFWKLKMRNWKLREQGIAFLLVVILLSAMFAISVGIFNVTFGQVIISGEIANSFLSLYAADQGIERALYCNRFVPPRPCATLAEDSKNPTRNLVGGALAREACYVVEVTGVGSGIVIIASTGQYRALPAQTTCTEDPAAQIIKRRFVAVYAE